MASVKKVIPIGNLGADPEIRATSSGDPICKLRLATTEKWKHKATGDARETTEWHRVVLFRRLAETARNYLRKGSPIYIEGRLRTSKWQIKDGNEHFTTEIEGNELKMLGSKPSSVEHQSPASEQQPTVADATPAISEVEYDYPF